MKKLSLILAQLILFSSCASMFSGTSEKIKLSSDVPGTKFYLEDEELGTDSATVKIAKKKLSETRFTAKKDGCKASHVDVQTKFDSTSLWGILLDFGIISILVVDWGITGAVREAERTNYVLNPKC
jgi:hypothetical protein